MAYLRQLSVLLCCNLGQGWRDEPICVQTCRLVIGLYSLHTAATRSQALAFHSLFADTVDGTPFELLFSGKALRPVHACNGQYRSEFSMSIAAVRTAICNPDTRGRGPKTLLNQHKSKQSR